MPKQRILRTPAPPRATGRAVLFEQIIEVVDPTPHSAALNMAIDEILLTTAEAPILRVYQWSKAAVSYGYFSKYDEVAAQWPTRDAVRRWTGGGIVLHGEDITYSLIVPRPHPFACGRAGESYRAIHECLADWMKNHGLRVELTDGAVKQSDECFANPAPHDIVAGEQKVSGAAQRRTRSGLLHQGSIQPVPAGFRAEAQSLASAFARRVEPQALTSIQLRAAETLAAEKYATTEWLRRW